MTDVATSPLSYAIERADQREKFMIPSNPRHEPIRFPFCSFRTPPTPRLDRSLVRDGCDALGYIVLQADRPCLPWCSWKSLEILWFALLLGLLCLGIVLLDALKEVFSRARMSDVLDTDVDALLDVSVSNLLVTVTILASENERLFVGQHTG